MTHIRIPTLLKRIGLIGGSLVIAALVATNVVLASATDNFFGYAWSPNVGWIKMNNCTTPTDCPTGASYGVRVAPTGSERAITGYAWSSNIGWITFTTQNQTSGYDVALNCPPTLSGGTRCGAYVSYGASGGPAVSVKGWARACSVYNDCTDPSRGLKDIYERGGWDGWIALGDTNTTDNASFGVTLNTSTGVMSGYGWGSAVVGWVNFSGVRVIDDCTTSGICICPDGTPAPNGDVSQCPVTPTTCPDGTPAPNNDVSQCPAGPVLCPDGTQAPNNDINQCSTTPVMCPNGSPAPNNDIGQCVDCSVIGSPCWCAQNGNPPAQCSGNGGDQCSNIPGDQDTIIPPYRQLADGRCLCVPGYVLNAQYQCVKPIYIEPKE